MCNTKCNIVAFTVQTHVQLYNFFVSDLSKCMHSQSLMGLALTVLIYIYIRRYVCMSVRLCDCLSAHNSETGMAITSKFQGRSRVPRKRFEAQKLWGSEVGGQRIYTFCFPLQQHGLTRQPGVLWQALVYSLGQH